MTETRALTTLSTSEILSGLRTVKSVLAPDLTDDELKLFAMVCNRSGLDPWAKQVYAVKRKGRVTFQTGIDGYRSIAARTGMYDGQDEPEYGPACGCGDNRPAGHPESVTVRVYRKGVGRAIAATAFWHEYIPAAGQSGEGDVMWRRMPRVMIAKVAEALALRKAFPYDPEQRQGIGADLYTADEMTQAARDESPAAPAPSARDRVAARAAAIAPQPVEPAADAPVEIGEPDPEPGADEIVGEAREVPSGLSVQALASLARGAGVTKARLADAIGTAAGVERPMVEQVNAVAAALTDAERGKVADELNLDWRPT